MKRFPQLDGFLHAWFHQDFDLDGDVPQVVTKFRAAATPNQVDEVRRDIVAFLAQTPGDADAEFARTFDPDVSPSGWHMTARDWLGWIDRLLAA